jgi:hypothetical protein
MNAEPDLEKKGVLENETSPISDIGTSMREKGSEFGYAVEVNVILYPFYPTVASVLFSVAKTAA